jgi:hypothetical protein
MHQQSDATLMVSNIPHTAQSRHRSQESPTLERIGRLDGDMQALQRQDVSQMSTSETEIRVGRRLLVIQCPSQILPVRVERRERCGDLEVGKVCNQDEEFVAQHE